VLSSTIRISGGPIWSFREAILLMLLFLLLFCDSMCGFNKDRSDILSSDDFLISFYSLACPKLKD